jgi:hypothetical protein
LRLGAIKREKRLSARSIFGEYGTIGTANSPPADKDRRTYKQPRRRVPEPPRNLPALLVPKAQTPPREPRVYRIRPRFWCKKPELSRRYIANAATQQHPETDFKKPIYPNFLLLH